jgi:predicted nuclease of predicted toxin-antitoxin system
VRFLGDECLSVQLVDIAASAGHEAHHVAQLALYGEPVNQVLEVGIDGEDVVFEFFKLPSLE